MPANAQGEMLGEHLKWQSGRFQETPFPWAASALQRRVSAQDKRWFSMTRAHRLNAAFECLLPKLSDLMTNNPT